MSKKVIIIFMQVCLYASLSADVVLSQLFTNGMVIQRNVRAPIWGQGDCGEKVSVSGDWGEMAITTVDAQGQWRVDLATPPAGGPYTITVKAKNTVVISNILSGEVWLCSGQSNMEFKMDQLSRYSDDRTEQIDQKTEHAILDEVKTAKDDQLRQFNVERTTNPFEAVKVLKGAWIDSSPEHNGEFSATAYFFGRELREELKVPIGLIKCAWGGTRVEPWIPAHAFTQDESMKVYYDESIENLKSMIKEFSPKAAEEGFQRAIKRWEANNKKGRKPRPQISPDKKNSVPSTLFNGMVSPVIPFAIRGVIWYQGESNSRHNNGVYEKHFGALIRSWREEWGQGDFPFYFAQLAAINVPSIEPVDYNGWVSICDQQRRTLAVKNTGMAVLNDIGEVKDIHPHNKIDVGKRLALWALKHDYPSTVLRDGRKALDVVCSGPLYHKHEVREGKVVITFNSAGSGLMSGEKIGLADTMQTQKPLKHFQICGEDRLWKWAQAEISGKDTVVVYNSEIPSPLHVRYAWAQNPAEANLYNKEGLPASVFTTEAEIYVPGVKE